MTRLSLSNHLTVKCQHCLIEQLDPVDSGVLPRPQVLHLKVCPSRLSLLSQVHRHARVSLVQLLWQCHGMAKVSLVDELPPACSLMSRPETPHFLGFLKFGIQGAFRLPVNLYALVEVR